MVAGVLVLEDGTVVEGTPFGAEGESEGEVVFNTSMSGYQEYLTDPSYRYQILMPTYPLIGNYGITSERFESDRVQVEGFVVRELCGKPSHGDLQKSLDDFLKENNVPGLSGVDTRFLTRKIRNFGVMLGILKCPYEKSELPKLVERAKNLESISNKDLIELVTTKEPIVHNEGAKSGKTVVMIDCGLKRSMIRSLVERDMKVVQVPATYTAKQILEYEPDGIMVSNGPGDPEKAQYAVNTIQRLFDTQIPMFGICMGNQLIGLACGAKTSKLKFGHRGGNQPVKELATGRAYVTSQNHGFVVDPETLSDEIAEVSHINLNDQSVEGLVHKELPVFSVQFHPEAHCGPWDADYLFDKFANMLG